MEQTNELSENERAIASELNETNEICEMSEQLVSMLRDEAEIIWSEADGSIYYTTKEMCGNNTTTHGKHNKVCKEIKILR